MRFSLNQILNLSVLVLGAPYFFGFVYMNAYYGYFGIDLSELGFSVQYIYVSAFFAFWESLNTLVGDEVKNVISLIGGVTLGWMFVVGLALVMLILGILWTYRSRLPRENVPKWVYPWDIGRPPDKKPSTIKTALQFVMVLLVYCLSLSVLYSFGASAGTKLASRDVHLFPYVAVTEISDKTSRDDLDPGNFNKMLFAYPKYRLVHTSETTVYLMRNAADLEFKRWIYRIPKHHSRIAIILQVLPE